MEFLTSPEFWIAVGQIIMIDILLGGDNAVVIALACRKLPPRQRTQGILWGTVGAIVLRVLLIFFALQLLAIPFLKIVGALLLLWIGVKLLVPEHESADGSHGGIEGNEKLWGAVRTVIIADFVMSLDNVIAISAAAEASATGHSMALVLFGVLVSIPIIVWGSQTVLKLMDRFPVIITLGGMLLGWIAGAMIVTDAVLVNPEVMPQMHKIEATAAVRYGASVAGALLVLALGRWLSWRRLEEVRPAAVAAVGPGRLRRILLAVDGSEASSRATRHLIALVQALRAPRSLELQVLNVQRPFTGDVSTFIASKSLEEYHQELADEALAPARRLLEAAAIPYSARYCLGTPPGPTIASEAKAQACDMIVMGTRGLGAAASLLGSVAQDALAASDIPILLVK
jgi:YjbE family integral membrane protein